MMASLLSSSLPHPNPMTAHKIPIITQVASVILMGGLASGTNKALYIALYRITIDVVKTFFTIIIFSRKG